MQVGEVGEGHAAGRAFSSWAENVASMHWTLVFDHGGKEGASS